MLPVSGYNTSRTTTPDRTPLIRVRVRIRVRRGGDVSGGGSSGGLFVRDSMLPATDTPGAVP